MKVVLAICLLIGLTCWGVIPEKYFVFFAVLLLIGALAELKQGSRRGYQPRAKPDYSRIKFPIGESGAVYPKERSNQND